MRDAQNQNTFENFWFKKHVLKQWKTGKSDHDFLQFLEMDLEACRDKGQGSLVSYFNVPAETHTLRSVQAWSKQGPPKWGPKVRPGPNVAALDKMWTRCENNVTITCEMM
jgi:hypothetical protein